MRPIVGRFDPDAGRKPLFEFSQLGFDTAYHLERILTVAHHDNAPDCFPSAVPLGDAEPHIRADRHLRHISNADRHTIAACTDRQIGDVAHSAQVTEASDHVVASGDLHGAPTDISIGRANRAHHGVGRHAESQQLRRIEEHLVLLDVPADARHLRHAGHAL